jgi:hypothetical protein
MPQFWIHVSVVRHLGRLHMLAVVSNAAVNTDVQVSVLLPGLHSFRYIPMNDNAGSHSNSTLSFEKPPYCFPQLLY